MRLALIVPGAGVVTDAVSNRAIPPPSSALAFTLSVALLAVRLTLVRFSLPVPSVPASQSMAPPERIGKKVEFVCPPVMTRLLIAVVKPIEPSSAASIKNTWSFNVESAWIVVVLEPFMPAPTMVIGSVTSRCPVVAFVVPVLAIDRWNVPEGNMMVSGDAKSLASALAFTTASRKLHGEDISVLLVLLQIWLGSGLPDEFSGTAGSSMRLTKNVGSGTGIMTEGIDWPS